MSTPLNVPLFSSFFNVGDIIEYERTCVPKILEDDPYPLRDHSSGEKNVKTALMMANVVFRLESEPHSAFGKAESPQEMLEVNAFAYIMSGEGSGARVTVLLPLCVPWRSEGMNTQKIIGDGVIYTSFILDAYEIILNGLPGVFPDATFARDGPIYFFDSHPDYESPLKKTPTTHFGLQQTDLRIEDLKVLKAESFDVFKCNIKKFFTA